MIQKMFKNLKKCPHNSKNICNFGKNVDGFEKDECTVFPRISFDGSISLGSIKPYNLHPKKKQSKPGKCHPKWFGLRSRVVLTQMLNQGHVRMNVDLVASELQRRALPRCSLGHAFE